MTWILNKLAVFTPCEKVDLTFHFPRILNLRMYFNLRMMLFPFKKLPF